MLSSSEDIILEEFYKLCEQILNGKADKDNISRLTKSMIALLIIGKKKKEVQSPFLSILRTPC